jgi:hypothetical protein
MAETIVPVITDAGEIWGRDAIFLTDIDLTEGHLQLKGYLRASACTGLSGDIDSAYTITFPGYLSVKVTELDFDAKEYTSSFDEILNSDEINKLIEMDRAESIYKIDNSYRHFIFRTYDLVFEVISKSFELVIYGEPGAENNATGSPVRT